MRNFVKIIIVAVLLLNNCKTFSQGCSDAGVCTINNIKDHSLNIPQESLERNYFQSGITYGIGDHDITVINPYVEYTGLISEKFSFSGKITYAFISGELADISSLGDVTISANLLVLKDEVSLLNFILGSKIPLNSGNLKEDNIALPMHYQSSLGTYDLIVGGNYVFMDVGVSIAWQQPIINSNENDFFKPTDQTLKEYKYTTTNSYKRSGDLVLRTSYRFSLLENKLFIRPAVLGIYHLANDSYVGIDGVRRDIDGSQGLTLNGNLFVTYRFSDSKQLEFSMGSPFMARESRPDGLTRKLVAGLEYIYSF